MKTTRGKMIRLVQRAAQNATEPTLVHSRSRRSEGYWSGREGGWRGIRGAGGSTRKMYQRSVPIGTPDVW